MLTIISLYFKLNLVLLLAFLLWTAVKQMARSSGQAMSFRHELKLARTYFLLATLAPFLTLLFSKYSGMQTELPGLSVIGQSISGNLDSGLSRTFTVGENSISAILMAALLLGSGVLAHMLLLVKRYRQLTGVLHKCIPFKHVNRVWIVFSQEISTPFSTQALGSTRIVLPFTLLQSPLNLRLALKHELQHVRSGDLRWVLFLEYLKPLFFWNPAFYAWHNEFHCLQEYACDEALVSKPAVSAQKYGTCLLEVASALSHQSPWAASNMVPHFGLFTSAQTQLKRRILMLDNMRNKNFSGTKATLYSVLLLLGLAGGSASMMAQEGTEDLAILPTKTVPPKYPATALDKGIVGWTVVTLTVDEKGNVANEEMVDACSVPSVYNAEAELDTDGCLLNRDIFKKSSLTAIAGFKFNPRLENGVAVATPGVQYMFKYTLSETDKSLNEILDQYGARRVPGRGGVRN